jgi:catechol 2,3-dioxygenase-like lactoylglutathione lyase family enzyme
MPNLENLKKQAKLFVRWHRGGHYPVAAHIRAVLPRYRDLSDSEVMEATFKLSDAQELIARQNGFESWQALVKEVHSMSPLPPEEGNTTPTIMGVEAQLFVADVAVSCEYYRSKLGFTLAYVYGDPPFYAQVQRDTAHLNLRCVEGSVFVEGIREREQLLSASMNLGSPAELRSIFLRYRDSGVEFHQTLTQQPGGARTFIVRDPDGNLVLFAAPST